MSGANSDLEDDFLSSADDGTAFGTRGGPPSDATVAVAVGVRAKAERLRADLTLQDLGARSGLSVGMLSRIENGQTSPSLRTLVRLSRALNIHVASLLGGVDQQDDASFVRAGEGIELQRAEASGGLRYELLVEPRISHAFIQPFLISVPTAREMFPRYQHAGSEFIHVLEGAMTFRYGTVLYTMSAGDSLLFNGVVLHGPEAVITAPVKFVAVTSDRLPGRPSMEGSGSEPYLDAQPHVGRGATQPGQERLRPRRGSNRPT
jgi:transcriptional regulator with XRE-family HTH domain